MTVEATLLPGTMQIALLSHADRADEDTVGHLGGPNLRQARRLHWHGAGGNKTRKLEFLVAEALASGADTLVTAGGVSIIAVRPQRSRRDTIALRTGFGRGTSHATRRGMTALEMCCLTECSGPNCTSSPEIQSPRSNLSVLPGIRSAAENLRDAYRRINRDRALGYVGCAEGLFDKAATAATVDAIVTVPAAVPRKLDFSSASLFWGIRRPWSVSARRNRAMTEARVHDCAARRPRSSGFCR
jgi:hypothetical protein